MFLVIQELAGKKLFRNIIYGIKIVFMAKSLFL